jgi:hypothetical protein
MGTSCPAHTGLCVPTSKQKFDSKAKTSSGEMACWGEEEAQEDLMAQCPPQS